MYILYDAYMHTLLLVLSQSNMSTANTLYAHS
jgi:hypothetical protein